MTYTAAADMLRGIASSSVDARQYVEPLCHTSERTQGATQGNPDLFGKPAFRW